MSPTEHATRRASFDTLLRESSLMVCVRPGIRQLLLHCPTSGIRQLLLRCPTSGIRQLLLHCSTSPIHGLAGNCSCIALPRASGNCSCIALPRASMPSPCPRHALALYKRRQADILSASLRAFRAHRSPPLRGPTEKKRAPGAQKQQQLPPRQHIWIAKVMPRSSWWRQSNDPFRPGTDDRIGTLTPDFQSLRAHLRAVSTVRLGHAVEPCAGDQWQLTADPRTAMLPANWGRPDQGWLCTDAQGDTADHSRCSAR